MSKILENFQKQITKNKKKVIKALQKKVFPPNSTDINDDYFKFKTFFDESLDGIIKNCEVDVNTLPVSNHYINIASFNKSSELKKLQNTDWTVDEAKKYLADKNYLNFSATEQVNEHLKILYKHQIFLEDFNKNNLPNQYYQKISNEVIIPSLTKWFVENKNLSKDEVAEIAEELWQILGKERSYIADIVNAPQKEIYGVMHKYKSLLDPMINSNYSNAWRGWIKYVEDRIEKELKNPASKIIINSSVTDELIKNELISLSKTKEKYLKEKLTIATHCGILHHEDDCTDGNLKQENAASYYFAYHTDDQQKIIFDVLFCVHKKTNKDAKTNILVNLFAVENIKDLYAGYYHANHETFYLRGSASVIGWLAKARAESLAIKFDLANDRYGSPIKLPFNGQLDQYALACLNVDEFINGLEVLNFGIFDHLDQNNDRSIFVRKKLITETTSTSQSDLYTISHPGCDGVFVTGNDASKIHTD